MYQITSIRQTSLYDGHFSLSQRVLVLRGSIVPGAQKEQRADANIFSRKYSKVVLTYVPLNQNKVVLLLLAFLRSEKWSTPNSTFEALTMFLIWEPAKNRIYSEENWWRHAYSHSRGHCINSLLSQFWLHKGWIVSRKEKGVSAFSKRRAVLREKCHVSAHPLRPLQAEDTAPMQYQGRRNRSGKIV